MTSTYSRQAVGQLIAAGRTEEAERLCRDALARGELDPTVYINLAHIAFQKRSFDEAAELLNEALAVDAQNSSALHNLGVISDQAGDLEAAEDYYRRAVAADADNPAPRRNLASLLFDVGRLEESRELYASTIKRTPNDAEAHFAYSRLARYTDDDPTLPALQALTRRGRQMGLDAQVKISFTVGKANQDLGRYEDAYRAFRSGNEVHYKARPYPEAQNYALLDDVRSKIDGAFLERYAAAGVEDPMPIFVLGMPRSGSTLIERMLSAHSAVAAAGEVKYLKACIQRHLIGDRETIGNALGLWTDRDLRNCASAYLEKLSTHADSCGRVVDKMPGNYAFIGLIAAMLPNAKIIHTVRHPMATIWSNYSTHFADALYYTYDLDVLGRYFLEYRKTMQHWQSVLSQDRVFDLHYERLVAEPEETLRSLFEYLELPWERACLEFHKAPGHVSTASRAQVRQPLYTAAVDLWQNYRQQLAPVEAQLLMGIRPRRTRPA